MIKVGELREFIKDLDDDEKIACCAFTGKRGVYFRVKTATLATMFDSGDNTRLYATEKTAKREVRTRKNREAKPVKTILIKDML